jgi:hypothetical protein
MYKNLLRSFFCVLATTAFLTPVAQAQAYVNLPLFDVPLSHFIMRPSIAVPEPAPV